MCSCGRGVAIRTRLGWAWAARVAERMSRLPGTGSKCNSMHPKMHYQPAAHYCNTVSATDSLTMHTTTSEMQHQPATHHWNMAPARLARPRPRSSCVAFSWYLFFCGRQTGAERKYERAGASSWYVFFFVGRQLGQWLGAGAGPGCPGSSHRPGKQKHGVMHLSAPMLACASALAMEMDSQMSMKQMRADCKGRIKPRLANPQNI